MERDELFRFRRYVQFNALPEDRNALVCVLVLILSCCICMVFFYLFFMWETTAGDRMSSQVTLFTWHSTVASMKPPSLTDNREPTNRCDTCYFSILSACVCVLSVHPPVLCSTFKTAVELCCIRQSCPVAVFPVGWREQRAALSVSHPEPRGSYLSASACCCVPLEELRGEALWLMTQ